MRTRIHVRMPNSSVLTEIRGEFSLMAYALSHTNLTGSGVSIMNASAKTGLIYSNDYLNHVTPSGHPESPRRAEVVMKALEDAALAARMERLQPRLATEQEI